MGPDLFDGGYYGHRRGRAVRGAGASCGGPRPAQGKQAFDSGRYDEALGIFSHLHSETKDPVYLRAIGRCYQKMGEPQKAIENFRAFLAQYPHLNRERRAEVESLIREEEAKLFPSKDSHAAASATAAGALNASAADRAKAKQHYQEAARQYDLAEYQPAMDNFREAYRLTGDPVFLFNIAQCYRKLGNTAEALSFYQTYLRRKPDAPNRDEVERRIKELESTAAAKVVPAPLVPAPPASEPQLAPGPALAAPAVEAAHAPPSPLPVVASPVEVQPAPSPGTDLATQATAPISETGGPAWYGRWWVWTAAGAVVAGGVVAAVLLTRGSSATPFCTICNDTAGIPTK